MKAPPFSLSAIVLSSGVVSLTFCQQARGASGSIAVYSGSPVEVPEATFFSFDDHSIPFRRNLHLTLVAPEKYGTSVVKRGAPGAFDELRAEYYGTVIKLNHAYHMWYNGYGFADPNVRTYRGVCVHVGYAESPDGIHWTKPDLGLVEFHGNKNNNMVEVEPQDYTAAYPDRNLHVLYEPDEPDPSRRYKMMFYVPFVGGGYSMVPLLSPDGFHWRYGIPPTVVPSPDGAPYPRFTTDSLPFPAEHLEGGSLVRVGGIYYENGQQLILPDGRLSGRVDSTFWSSDFIHWNHEKALSFVRYGVNPVRDNFRLPLRGDGEQVHEGTALWNRGNVLVGIYGRWEGSKGLSQSHIDLGLNTSVDAIHFSEPDPTFVFATHGKEGDWDSGGVLQGQGFQNINGKTYFWYGSWNLTASGDKFDEATDMLTSHGEIGLMILRQDGFGYFSILDPKTAHPHETFASGEGSLLTARFRVNGSPAEVLLNVDRGNGVAVQLLDSRGVVVPGYDFSDFVPLPEGGIRQPISWNGHPDIPEGGPYILRVALKYQENGSPKLYAIYVKATSNP